MIQKRLIVTGKVQGVWYRATIKDHADRLGLFGYAKNIKDGSVEVVVQGEDKELQALKKLCFEGSDTSDVLSVDEYLEPIKTEFESFEIL